MITFLLATICLAIAFAGAPAMAEEGIFLEPEIAKPESVEEVARSQREFPISLLQVMPAGSVRLPDISSVLRVSDESPNTVKNLTKALSEGEPVLPGSTAQSGKHDQSSGTNPISNGPTGNASRDDPQGLIPEAAPPGALDAAGIRSMRTSFKAYYDYRINGFAHRTEVFRWQLNSSRAIFAMVLAIVVAGLYFSWMQFHQGLKTGDLDKDTTVEASTTGLKVSSPVLGVIILALSLGFFYLYLVHVYPIEEIF